MVNLTTTDEDILGFILARADEGLASALAERFGVEFIPPHRRGGMAWAIGGHSGNSPDWETANANRTQGDEREVAIAQLEVAMINRFGKLPTADAWRDPTFAKWDIPLDQFYRECGISDEAIRLIETTSNCETLATTSALFQMKEIQSISSWGKQGGGMEGHSAMAAVLDALILLSGVASFLLTRNGSEAAIQSAPVKLNWREKLATIASNRPYMLLLCVKLFQLVANNGLYFSAQSFFRRAKP